jgi:glycosyltransferase involved in cell wall biosynthesis
MQEPHHGRPFRATVAVTGYNQEDSIRAAISGALAQNQNELEIILSDDCSADNTFSIMQDEARTYVGLNTVVLNRNERNLGIVGHVNRLFEMASSDFIILCHGDDVSVPYRVQRVLEMFAKEKPLLIHSLADVIDGQGKPEEQHYRSASFFKSTDPLEVATSTGLYLGATGAYHKDIMRKFGPLHYKNTFEDLTLGFRAALEGRVSFIEHPLVHYRPSLGISAVGARSTSIRQQVEKRAKSLAFRVATLEQRLRDANRSNHPDVKEIRQRIADKLEDQKLRLSFYDGVSTSKLNWAAHPLRTLASSISEANRVLRKW